MRTIVLCSLFALLSLCEVLASYPDGTLILSSKKGLIGRIAKRSTGGDQYTHIAIIIDNYVYEMDYPRSKKTPLSNYKYKRLSTNDFYVPTSSFTEAEINLMRNYAENHLGEPYQLRNYCNPQSPRTRGTWCSVWVGRVLSASLRYRLCFSCSFTPQKIFGLIGQNYQFSERISK